MPRFFFHLYNGFGVLLDEEGQLLPSLKEAHAVALASIRSVLGDELTEGALDLNGRIDVVSERQEVLLTVSFEEAVTVRHASDS